MPAYNAAKYITDAINSVLCQSEPSWELIIINDGSTDHTAQKVAAYIQDPRIRYFGQPNTGVGTARNVALRLARGKYLCFLDADDQLPPGSLQARIQFLERYQEFDVVDSGVEIRDANMKGLLRYYQPSFTGLWWQDLVTLSGKSFFGPNAFFRRSPSLLLFRQGITHSEDLMFYLENAYHHRWLVGRLDHVCYLYRITPGSAMRNIDGLANGYNVFLEYCRGIPEVSWSHYLSVWVKVRKILLLSYLRDGSYRKALRQLYP